MVVHASPQEVVGLIERLRSSAMDGAKLGDALGMPYSTVIAVRRRLGENGLSRLDSVQLSNRYQRRHAGELIHVDIEKLRSISRPGHRVNGDRTTRSRGIGWEYLHVAVTSPLGWPTPRSSVTGRPRRRPRRSCAAVASFRRGVPVQWVMTDKGAGYRSATMPAPVTSSAFATSAPGPTVPAPRA